ETDQVTIIVRCAEYALKVRSELVLNLSNLLDHDTINTHPSAEIVLNVWDRSAVDDSEGTELTRTWRTVDRSEKGSFADHSLECSCRHVLKRADVGGILVRVVDRVRRNNHFNLETQARVIRVKLDDVTGDTGERGIRSK